jgi:hypothetical protein
VKHAAIAGLGVAWLLTLGLARAEPEVASPASPPRAPEAALVPVVAPPPEAPANTVPSWLALVKLEAFVDAYASINYNFPKPESGKNLFRAFDDTNGFALHWVGVNASVLPDPVGGSISLRFGRGALLYNGTDATAGLVNVKQAFASWKPLGKASKLTLDFGKFDQPYGSELADSQLNVNYTRSFLYWLAQPLFFTGLRADYAFSDAVDLKVVAVNGWNGSIDVNRGKSFGAQLNVKPIDTLLVALGYLVGPEQSDYDPGAAAVGGAPARPASHVPGASSRLRQLVDVVVDLAVTPELRALFNANYGRETLPIITAEWYGANLALRYAFASALSVAVRGEWYRDADGFTTSTGQPTTLLGGTLTLGFNPTPNLIVKLEQRADVASTRDDTALFPRSAVDAAKTQVTTTLGLVATTN